MNLIEMRIMYILVIVDKLLNKFMSALTQTFDYSWSDTLVEQELKELESIAAESSEIINHDFSNTVVIDNIRAKGF